MPSMSGTFRVVGTGLLSSLLPALGRLLACVTTWLWSTLLLLPLISVTGIASAQQVDQKLWEVDPQVALTAATVLGKTLYVGGSFHDVAPVVGGGAITDPVTGVLRPNSPRVAGIVLTCIPDGHRGWYIGGDFSGVGGLPRKNLAHIFGDWDSPHFVDSLIMLPTA